MPTTVSRKRKRSQRKLHLLLWIVGALVCTLRRLPPAQPRVQNDQELALEVLQHFQQQQSEMPLQSIQPRNHTLPPIPHGPPPPTIAYLIQGPASSFARIWNILQHLVHIQVYFHSFDHPMDMTTTFGNHHKPIGLYQPNTTFYQGRHLLLRRALHDQASRNLVYYVFVDHDVELLCGDALQWHLDSGAKSLPQVQCWKDYTRTLLTPRPRPPKPKMTLPKRTGGSVQARAAAYAAARAVARAKEEEEQVTEPLYWPLQRPGSLRFDQEDAFSIKWQSCVDANFQAIHRDALWLLYPVSYQHQQTSWHVMGLAHHVVAQRCYPTLWKVDNRYMVVNPEHASYPQQHSLQLLPSYLNYTYSALGPWDTATLQQRYRPGHRCHVSSTPPPLALLDAVCNQTLRQRFAQWGATAFEPELQLPEMAAVET